MDPKALASLDPKLRETYERVMGTSTSPSAPSTSGSAPSATSATPTPPIPSPTLATSDPATPPIPPPSPVSPPIDTSSIITGQPIQAADLVALQPSLTGTPLPASSTDLSAPLGKPMQPLPSPASINQAITSSGHSSSPMIRILYIVAATVFFVVYTIFWLKIFHYPLPFLPF